MYHGPVNTLRTGACALVIALAFSRSDLLGVEFDETLGAKADGKTPDRDSINKAIEAASAAGGGTVYFPAGTYLTGSIRLRSNITLRLEQGARIEASADPAAYDAAEPNDSSKYRTVFAAPSQQSHLGKSRTSPSSAKASSAARCCRAAIKEPAVAIAS